MNEYQFRTTSEETEKIYSQLAVAQGHFPMLERTKTGSTGARPYQYADLTVVMNNIRAPLMNAGLIVFHTSFPGYSETRIVHVDSQQWIAACLKLDDHGTDQDQGKSLTYARRYCILGLTGIVADEDTDGANRSPNPKGNGVATEEAKEEDLDARIIVFDEFLKNCTSPGDVDKFWKDNKKTLGALQNNKPEVFQMVKENFMNKKKELRNAG